MIKLARKLLENTDESQRVRVVAICKDKRGRPLGTAVNSYAKSHPRQARLASQTGSDKKIYLHAEVRAILRCRQKPYSIFVARFNRQGRTGFAAPCPICSLAIKEAGIKLVEYTT